MTLLVSSTDDVLFENEVKQLYIQLENTFQECSLTVYYFKSWSLVGIKWIMFMKWNIHNLVNTESSKTRRYGLMDSDLLILFVFK